MRNGLSMLVSLCLVVLGGGLGGGGASTAQAQDMATYYETGDFLGAPPATFREGLLGYANPALPTLAGDHLVTAWTTDGREAASLRDWGVFGSLRGLGAGVVRRRPGALRLTGYHLSLSGGDEDAAFGVGYQGFAGDATALGRYNRLRFGSIARPVKYLSVGLTGTVALETDDREVVGEIGVRPLGTSRLTLFADAAWGEGQALVDVPWSAGASVEVVDGIDLRGRVLDGETVSIGLRVGLGRGGLDSQSRIDTEGEYGGQTNRLRLGDYTPSRIAERGRAGEEHVEVSLQGPVRYQEATFAGLFGDVPPRFYEVLRTIDQSAEEERVAAVALNLSGLQVQPELAWELREAVREAQERGVTVVAFLENGGMTSYHLASVADQVVLDPQGTLTLPGYAAGRTFVKGTLEKLGLGVQAWRFFEYKSAFERFSRTDYSRADSLQRKAYVDDQYELARADVAGSRPVSPDSLDRLIDEKTLLTATEARQAGLVDTLARWAGRETVLKRAVGEETASLDADALDQIATASRRWGAPDEVALVYGIGATQVEQGMNSRSLSEKLRGLAEDDDVAAVVFRVDSPGGSPVAADQVAAALRKCAEKKPVVVSQGQVAGSGGYWVSAYADTIVAGPNTVTGSIGVIGGWIYDETFSEKTGLTSDVVQRGARADLLKGIRLPLVGLSVPTRKLTEEELARVETVIRTQYDQFVDVVAEGRDTTTAHVRDVGAGRIYSGRAGRDVGLVDEVGGVRRALELARQAAGLPADEVQIREVNPESGTFDVGQLLPGLLGTLVEDPTEPQPAAQADPTGTFLRLMLEHQPGPLVLLPPGTIPAGE